MTEKRKHHGTRPGASLPQNELVRPNPVEDNHQRLRHLCNDFDIQTAIAKKDRLAGEIVREATEESYDCVSIFLAFKKGIDLVTTGKDKQYGGKILQGIEDYFTDLGISHKYLFNSAGNYSREYAELKALDDEIRRNLTGSKGVLYSKAKGPLTPASRHFIDRTMQIVDKYRGVIEGDSKTNLVVNSVAHPEKITDERKYNEGLALIHQAINQKSVEYRIGDTPKPSLLKRPEEVFELISQANKLGDLGVPDMLTRRNRYMDATAQSPDSGTISLQDVFEQLDPESMTRAALTFIGAMPRGDVLWQHIASSIFLTPQHIDVRFHKPSYFTNPDFTERVFNAQTQMVGMMMFPLFYPEGVFDADFQDRLNFALSNLNYENHAMLALATYKSLTYGPFFVQAMHPEKNPIDTIEACLGTELIVADFFKNHPSQRIILSDGIAHSFLRDNQERVRTLWGTRFPATTKYKVFNDTFAQLLTRDFRDIHTGAYIDKVKEHMGEDGFNKLNERHHELSRVAELMWIDALNSPGISYWPSSDALHQINFSAGSLERRLGLSAMRFIPVSEEPGSKVEFTLVTQDHMLDMVGVIGTDGHLSLKETSFDFDKKFPGFKALINMIVTANFHDFLLGRPEMVEEGSPAVRLSVREEEREDGVGSVDKEVKKREKRGRPVPRRIYTYKTLPGNIEAVDAGDILDVLNEKRVERGYSPRKVDLHRRRVEGSSRFEKAVTNWLADKSEANTRELDLALIELKKPSQVKILTVPVIRRAEVIIDPHTGARQRVEQTLMLEKLADPRTGEFHDLYTWVIKHSSPKPTIEDLRSPSRMYLKLYRTEPATAFLHNYVGLMGLEDFIQ